MIIKAVAAAILLASPLAIGPASAQAVISPDTEPSGQTTGEKKDQPSSVEGAGTVTSRAMSDGVTTPKPPAEAAGKGNAEAPPVR